MSLEQNPILTGVPSILVISRETTIQPIVSIRESLKDVRLIVLVGAAVDPAVMTGRMACGRRGLWPVAG